MRESINYMIPLPYDNMNDIIINVGTKNFLTNVSSNAYYGYQPQPHVQNKEDFINSTKAQATKDNTMEVQYDWIEENSNMQTESDFKRHANRKRRCCYDEITKIKKRRQNNHISSNIDDSTNLTLDEQMQTSALQKAVHLRKPTHNIPDVPRCMMELEKSEALQKEDKERAELEEILRETHGGNIYHWFQNED